MADGAYRCSLTLPAEQAVLLSDVAKHLAASQSAVVSILLESALSELMAGMDQDTAVTGPPRRWGGQNAGALRELIGSILQRGRAALYQQQQLPL